MSDPGRCGSYEEVENTSSLVAKAHGLIEAGRAQDAVRLLDSPAGALDPQALFTLAIWNVAGQVVPRNLQLAKEFFRRSANAGNLDAAHFYVAFVAHGAGGTADWRSGLKLLEQLAKIDADAHRQLATIQAMDLLPNGEPASLPKAEKLSSSPDVWRLPALFTPDECMFLIETAAPRLQRALVVDRGSGQMYQTHVRTSDTAAFPLIFEDPAVHALNRRLAKVSNTKVEQGEPLQVLRYAPGQEYKPHFDALPAGSNQRVFTVLVYLNEDYEGGETAFLSTGLKVRGRLGDGLLFRNAFADGRPDPSSEHAGLPVVRGTKMIASRWIRAKPIDLLKPLV